MSKFYEEVCLLDQPFIKEQSFTIKDLIAQKVGKLGENITVRRFARFKVGDPDWTVARPRPSKRRPSNRDSSMGVEASGQGPEHQLRAFPFQMPDEMLLRGLFRCRIIRLLAIPGRSNMIGEFVSAEVIRKARIRLWQHRHSNRATTLRADCRHRDGVRADWRAPWDLQPRRTKMCCSVS